MAELPHDDASRKKLKLYAISREYQRQTSRYMFEATDPNYNSYIVLRREGIKLPLLQD